MSIGVSLVALLAGAPAWAQTAEKHVLLEVYVGAWCTQCTDVSPYVDPLRAAWGDRLVVVEAHSSDGMSFSGSPANGIAAFPVGRVDGGPELTRGAWGAEVAARMDEAPAASLRLYQRYAPTTRVLDVEVTATFGADVPGPTQLRLYLVEDGLTGTGTGWDQANAYDGAVGHPGQGRGDPIVGYVHDRVLRAIPTGLQDDGAIGANATEGQVETERWQLTLPSGWDPDHLTVVPFLVDATGPLDTRRVHDVVELPLGAAPAFELHGATGAGLPLDVGEVLVGRAGAEVLTITSAGELPLVFGALAPFTESTLSVDIDDCSHATLAPGQTCSIRVVFAPDAAGAVSDVLSLTYDGYGGPLTLAVDVTASGVAPDFSLTGTTGPTDDALLDFGRVRLGASAQRVVTVHSSGTAPLQLSNVIALVEPAFTIPDHDCSAATLEPQQTCAITVRFAPTTSSPVFDDVTIPLIADVPRDLSIALTGVGNGAPEAHDDAYPIVAGQTLVVDAPGVLANDADPEHDTVLPEIVDGLPGIRIGSDGSFELPTDVGDAGTVLVFTYALRDLLGRGEPATVTVTVTDPDEDDDDDPTTCGCDAAGSGVAGAWVLVALLARRRRARRTP